jgi:hypothetical protein
MKRRASALMLVESLLAVGAFRTALAAPVVIVDSRHTLAFAEAACSLYPDPTAVAVCHSVDDPRKLGRDLENKVVSQFAATVQCRGVDIALLLDPMYDGDFNQTAIDLMRKDYWSLYLDYAPVGQQYNWVLFAEPSVSTGDKFASSIKSGERRTAAGQGTVAQISQQVCGAVTGRGVNIH